MCQCAAGHRQADCSTLWDRGGMRTAGCGKAAYKPDCSPAYISGAESTEESALAETCRVTVDRHPHGSPTDRNKDCDLIDLCLDRFIAIGFSVIDSRVKFSDFKSSKFLDIDF